MSQELPERFSITSVESALSLPTATDEHLGAVLIKVGHGDALARQPLRKIGK
jgi:hypothetical protein